MRDKLQEDPAQRASLTLGFAANTGNDMRRYNQPTVREVAAVFAGPDGAPPTNRDIVVWPKEEAGYRVSERNDLVDPLSYALLFPNGTAGWSESLRHMAEQQTKSYNKLTAGQFYAHRLMVRNLDNPIPHGAGLLFQQYLVDVYCRVEAMRLSYLRTHQQELRAESYQELRSACASKDFRSGNSTVGRRVVLPASYPGSPRHMQGNYLDALAMVRVLGKPDDLITFTANPSWPEILAALRPGQSPHDRPDIVARVFHLKLQALLHDLVAEGVLGKAVGWTWVVEFQKRGLPHAHILLIVASADKPRTPADIDARVCAELPDPDDPDAAELLNIISRSHVHGPCGVRNPSAPCMEGGECSKGYPRKFSEATTMPQAVYPIYRRRDSGRTIEKNGHVMDSRDVVPYNPLLTRKYGAHINVEIVTSIRSVKYLFKYTYKGHDRATLEVGFDEITDHVDARYVGPAEAVWRLLEFPMSGRSHSVERFVMHQAVGASFVHELNFHRI